MISYDYFYAITIEGDRKKKERKNLNNIVKRLLNQTKSFSITSQINR